MKKFAISLIALAAVSTVALANSNRSNELRDADTYVGQYAQDLNSTNSNAAPFAVNGVNSGSGLSLNAYAKRAQAENHGDRQ